MNKNYYWPRRQARSSVHEAGISFFRRRGIIPDFGFYARESHPSLIRENRLIAGVSSLSELNTKLRQLCLMEKEARQCTYADAEVLAQYAGLTPHTMEHSDLRRRQSRPDGAGGTVPTRRVWNWREPI